MTNTPNSFLLDEIRLNREAINQVGEKLSTKVSRVELFSWFSLLGLFAGLFAVFS